MQVNEFITKLFDKAKSEGFEAYEAYVADGSSFECSVFKGEIINYSSADSSGLGFRAIINGKVGCANTQALDEEAIDLLISAAKTNAELISSDDKQFMHDGGGEYAHIDGFNEKIESIPTADKIALAKDMETRALALDKRIEQVDGCEVITESGSTRIVNSLGLDVSFKSNIFAGYVSAVAREGELVNSGFKIFATPDDPDKADIDGTIKGSVEEAIDGLYAESVASGEYKMILRHDAMSDLLHTFSMIFSADAAQKGMSLLAGREGEKIAADCVTITDDPHMKGALASVPFDGEGVPTYAKNIVERGALTTLMHNLKTAHKQNVRTTANGSRPSYSSPVGVEPTNFFVAPGEGTLDEMCEKLGNGLLICDLAGLHAGANPISGDFSLSAKGYLVENGKRGKAVNQITVAGNFYQLLKDISAVGADLRFGFPGSSCYGSPSVLVEKLSVAGK